MAFPCVRQHDQNDCGPAVLATIAKYHGLPLSIGRAREACRSDAAGTNLLGLVAGAEALGFAATGAKSPSYDALKGAIGKTGPLIVHVITKPPKLSSEVGHFLVVYKATDDAVSVADPAEGLRTVPRAEFEAMWTQALVVVAPTPKLAGVEASVSSYRRFAGLLAGRWKLFVEAAIAAVIFAALGLTTSFYVQHLVDSVLLQGRIELLHLASAGVLLLVVFRVGFYVIQGYLLVHLSQKIDVALTLEYYQHVLRMPLSFFESRRTGEILSRLADARKIRQAISGAVLASVVDCLFVIVASVVMFAYNWRLALVTVFTVPIFGLVVFSHRGAVRRENRKGKVQNGELQAQLLEVIVGNAAVKASRAELHAKRDAEHLLVKSARTFTRLYLLSLSTESLSILITSVASVAILWYGGTLVIHKSLTVGQLLFFNSILAHLLEPLSRLATAQLDIEDGVIAADRVGEILDLSPEEKRGTERLKPARLEGSLVLDDVRFRYGYRSWVLDGVTIEIPAGSTVALVGHSGSGKTTISKLAARFYEPTEGRILLDGQDLCDIDLGWYRSRIGVVDQECAVFSHSIKDNIRLGKTNVTFDQIVAAAKAAGAHEFIEALPDRYETLVGERGCNLSGGQRQRLAIARAILGDPRILILDEATSHLDSETEREVQATLREVARGRTTVIIAHRLSTVMLADAIYVLDRGKIIEEGTHDELMAKDGAYADMWMSQVPAAMLKARSTGQLALDLLKSGEFVIFDDSDEGTVISGVDEL